MDRFATVAQLKSAGPSIATRSRNLSARHSQRSPKESPCELQRSGRQRRQPHVRQPANTRISTRRRQRGHWDGDYLHKRKWLRWRTFNRACERANELQQLADYASVVRVARLLG